MGVKRQKEVEQDEAGSTPEHHVYSDTGDISTASILHNTPNPTPPHNTRPALSAQPRRRGVLCDGWGSVCCVVYSWCWVLGVLAVKVGSGGAGAVCVGVCEQDVVVCMELQIMESAPCRC